MLSTIIQKFTHASPPDTVSTEAATLLASCSLPDPADLRRQLDAFQSQLRTDDEAWERYDRTSNPHAFLQQTQISERRERLLLQIDALRTQVATAERRRAAFLRLVDILRAMDQQIVQQCHQFYAAVLTASKDERRAGVASLDGLMRARARLAAPLAAVAARREFRRTPDPLSALAHDLRTCADEIDRALGPGMPRAPITLPGGTLELLGVLTDGRSA